MKPLAKKCLDSEFNFPLSGYKPSISPSRFIQGIFKSASIRGADSLPSRVIAVTSSCSRRASGKLANFVKRGKKTLGESGKEKKARRALPLRSRGRDRRGMCTHVDTATSLRCACTGISLRPPGENTPPACYVKRVVGAPYSRDTYL